MSWVATAVLGGAAISAGGAVGGSAIAANSAKAETLSPGDILSNTTAPLANPLINALVGRNTALAGAVDETIPLQASPLNQVLAGMRSSGTNRSNLIQGLDIINKLSRGIQSGELTYEDLVKFENGEFPTATTADGRVHEGPVGLSFNDVRRARRLLTENSPFSSLSDLFRAEQNFQTETASNQERLRKLALQSREQTDQVSQGIASLLQQALPLANFDDLTSQAKAGLLQNIEKEQSAALARANAGGYNPGSALESLTNARLGADIGAFNIASQISQGRQGILGNTASLLNALDPMTRAQNLDIAALLPQSSALVSRGQTSMSPIGSGVAAGAGALGNSIASIPLMQELLSNQGTGDTSPGTS